MPNNNHPIPKTFTKMTVKEFCKLISWKFWGEKKQYLAEIKHEPKFKEKLEKLRIEQELLESYSNTLSEEPKKLVDN